MTFPVKASAAAKYADTDWIDAGEETPPTAIFRLFQLHLASTQFRIGTPLRTLEFEPDVFQIDRTNWGIRNQLGPAFDTERVVFYVFMLAPRAIHPKALQCAKKLNVATHLSMLTRPDLYCPRIAGRVDLDDLAPDVEVLNLWARLATDGARLVERATNEGSGWSSRSPAPTRASALSCIILFHASISLAHSSGLSACTTWSATEFRPSSV